MKSQRIAQPPARCISALARAGRRRTPPRSPARRTPAPRAWSSRRRAVEELLAVGENQQALAVALGLGEVVGGEDDRRPAAGQAEHELPEPLALARVEPGARLVEQQHRRAGQEPDRDVDPLLVAAREGPRLVVAAVLEGGLREHLLDRRVRIGHLLEPGEQAEVLGDGEPPVERRLLGNPADLARWPAHRSGVRPPDSGEDREQRRLPGAVRADDGEELSTVGGEAHAPSALRGRQRPWRARASRSRPRRLPPARSRRES